MASGRESSHGILAGAVARPNGLFLAGLLGHWFCIIECRLLVVVRFDRMAWSFLARCCSGSYSLRLHPLFREGARGLGRESPEATRAKAGDPCADLDHLFARSS